MIFLTYNDAYSGIYKSQVIDVCSLFEKQLHCPTRLVALVSVRHYLSQRRSIKSTYAKAVVIPMMPTAALWKLNSLALFFLLLFTGERKIWARGPFACNIALALKKSGLVKKVIFDARGAYKAELTEYSVVSSEKVKKEIGLIEKKTLIESDKQLAVSFKLVEWWDREYKFIPHAHRVIPCTLQEDLLSVFPTEIEILALREALGFSKEDIVLVYSGSSAGWQSFELVDDYLFDVMNSDPKIKLLFLSNSQPVNSRVFAAFSSRIVRKWVKPNEVRKLLLCGDYGLLIRENSVTNQVASPVKFAEYLACGLDVIISEGIGDFSSFVSEKECGQYYSKNTSLSTIPHEKKTANHQLAVQYFSKEGPQISEAYSYLLAD